MSVKGTSTVADSVVRSKTIRRTSWRVSKLALLRVKVATVVLSMVLFLASLTGIAIHNPGVGSEAVAVVQAQQITVVKPGGSASVVLAPPPSVTTVRPLVRSRAS